MSNLNVFVVELERIMKNWPDRVPWAVSQIAMYTQLDSKLVAKWLGSALGKSLDIQDRLVFEDGEKALDILKGVLADGDHLPGVAEDESKAATHFLNMRKKVAPLLQSKNWRQAYKNLSYFMGQSGKALQLTDKLEGYAECLRVGCKAEIPVQELSGWLRLGVEAALEDRTARGVDDALDLLDAYGANFASEKNNEFLEEMFKKLLAVAREHGGEDKVNDCRRQLIEDKV